MWKTEKETRETLLHSVHTKDVYLAVQDYFYKYDRVYYKINLDPYSDHIYTLVAVDKDNYYVIILEVRIEKAIQDDCYWARKSFINHLRGNGNRKDKNNNFILLDKDFEEEKI